MNSVESYFILNSQGIQKSQWQVHVTRSDSTIYGYGSESVVRPVDAVSQFARFPVVLKTYDEWYDASEMERFSRNTELTNIFAQQQYRGYQLLRNANYQLRHSGDQGFPIVPVCRLAVRESDQRLALIQTDLTHMTHSDPSVLIEMKDLLNHTLPRSVISMAFDQIRLPFTTELYRSLVALALTDIQKDVLRAGRTGIVIRPPDAIVDYTIEFAREFPHQFSSWGMVVTGRGAAFTVMHDYSNIHETGDSTYVKQAIARVEDIFFPQ